MRAAIQSSAGSEPCDVPGALGIEPCGKRLPPLKSRDARMEPTEPRTRTILGQKSWTLSCDGVSLAITERGGHLGPATFRVDTRRIEPFAVAPWWNESVSAPPILQVLRGDFFCMAFGGNERSHRGERHDVHSETANRKWEWVRTARTREAALIELRMRTRARPGLVEKFVEIRKGHPAIYQRHLISGMSGRINPGHHAMLRFRTGGLISTSPIRFGQVLPERTEDPARGGYSCLRPGAEFERLDCVPALDGSTADLSRYPAREGFEDIARVSAAPSAFAWTAVTFPAEGWLWIGFKDPSVLASTLLWHSNGGRHYPPWNGRHRAVLGLEEITAFFHKGIAESVAPNSLSRRGIPTSLRLSPRRPTAINYLMAVVPIPKGFDHLERVERMDGMRVGLTARSGKSTSTTLDLDFLHER